MSETLTAQPDDSTAASDVTEIADVPVPPPGELPGRFLREAREARGLTVADVASTLKFGARQIGALEADDFSSLQGSTFVRGFVRSYARYLKLAPEPLLAMLEDGAMIKRAEVRPPDDTGVSMPMQGARRLSPWIAATILLVLAAGGLIVWQLVSPETAAPPRSDTVAEPAKGNAQVELQAPVARIEQPAAAEGAGAAPSQAAVADIPPGGKQLSFLFSDKSWLEVKDASQRVLLSGVFPSGDRQLVGGKPPFYLWVGRASALRVLDGEREIDLKPHARDDVARLTVE